MRRGTVPRGRDGRRNDGFPRLAPVSGHSIRAPPVHYSGGVRWFRRVPRLPPHQRRRTRWWCQRWRFPRSERLRISRLRGARRIHATGSPSTREDEPAFRWWEMIFECANVALSALSGNGTGYFPSREVRHRIPGVLPTRARWTLVVRYHGSRGARLPGSGTPPGACPEFVLCGVRLLLPRRGQTRRIR